MTAEQIAELERNVGFTRDAGLLLMVEPAMLRRVLLERWRLLEALKRERDHTAGIHDEGLDAIAFAEADAEDAA